jgi:hypothetical protein
MVTAFDIMIDAEFSDPNLSVAATYRPLAGGSLSIRAVRRGPVSEINMLQTRANVPAYAIDVRFSEVSQPRNGDQLDIDDDSFIVKSYEADSEKLIWKLNVTKKA